MTTRRRRKARTLTMRRRIKKENDTENQRESWRKIERMSVVSKTGE